VDVDSLWVSNSLVPFSITAGVMLLVLWPTRHSGKRMLQRWGIAEPAEEQKVLAIRYLRQRRILFVFLFVVSAMAELLWSSRADKGFSFGIFVPLLAAMLIAELIATLRPAGGGVRVASLDRRTWRDLVPTWAVVLSGTFVAATLAVLTLVVLARPWAEQYVADVPREENRGVLEHANAWSTLGWLVGYVALLAVLVFLAVRRPSVPDAQVDAALRTRTARVAVGIGFLLLGGLFDVARGRLGTLQVMASGAHEVGAPPPGYLTEDVRQVLEIAGFVAAVVAFGCWLTLAVPNRKTPVRAA
jgi:hypothetical protein